MYVNVYICTCICRCVSLLYQPEVTPAKSSTKFYTPNIEAVCRHYQNSPHRKFGSSFDQIELNDSAPLRHSQSFRPYQMEYYCQLMSIFFALGLQLNDAICPNSTVLSICKIHELDVLKVALHSKLVALLFSHKNMHLRMKTRHNEVQKQAIIANFAGL